jgi:hypothetical protein
MNALKKIKSTNMKKGVYGIDLGFHMDGSSLGGDDDTCFISTSAIPMVRERESVYLITKERVHPIFTLTLSLYQSFSISLYPMCVFICILHIKVYSKLCVVFFIVLNGFFLISSLCIYINKGAGDG